MSVEIKEISFEDILPLWKNNLWPERTSKIEPTSAINIEAKIDMSIMTYSPHFVGVFANLRLVSVLSGHQTSEKNYRLRGLWVAHEFRNLGYGTKIMDHMILNAKQLGFDQVWILNRVYNEDYFKKFGFERLFKVDTFEYGPHYVMCKYLNDR